MRKSDLKKNHELFDESIERYRQFMEKIVNTQRVVSETQEKRDLAESVILRLSANWERFVDEHLVDCVNCDHSMLSEYFGTNIPANPGKDLCEALIFGAGYKDFRSVADLIRFSKKVLPETKNPFLLISKTHRKRIDEVYKIRNYLSHYSAVAQRSLRKMYKTEYGMDRFLEPGQFLLAYSAKRL